MSGLVAWAVLALGLTTWLAHHRVAAVRAPRLDFDPSPFNRGLLPKLEQLRRAYVPTPWLYNAHLQLLWLMLQEAAAPRLRYDRTDLMTMSDGGTTALDWLGLDRAATTPTLVVLPSITGDAQSTRRVVRDLHRHTGWRVVVCTRRGHGNLELTAPVFNTMGCAQDLREQVARIAALLPESPLYAVGVSAGSAVLVRYLGEEGSRTPIRSGVAYCPGYDLGVAWPRVRPLYSRLMARRLKRYFLLRHARTLARLEGYENCLAARNLAEFHEQIHGLAGCRDYEDYLARSNPMRVFERIAVPVMVLNAADDPVCVAENAREHVDAVRRVPDALMVRTARGSHCAFLEGWVPRSWANRLIASYLSATEELLSPRDSLSRPASWS